MRFDTLLAHPWFHTWLAALIAIVAATAVHRIAQAVLSRITRPMPLVHAIVKAVRSAAGFVLPLIALQGVWQAAPDDLHFIDRVRHLNGLLLIACMTWAVVRVIRGFADGVIAAHPVDVEDNMNARRILTQTRVIARSAMSIAVVIGAAMMLMTFPGAKQVGASLLASAGVIGIVGGLAAKPVFSNLIAGLQIALAQPIRIDDVLIVEGEWGRVEEITGSYVVLKIWDDRRLIIPLQYFIEKPFQNWTRNSSQLLGSVFFYVDFGMPIAPLRAEVERIVRASPNWDQRFFNLVVTDTTERTMQLRVLCTAASSGQAFDLRCQVREGLIDFMQREYPQFLPRTRIEGDRPAGPPALAPQPA
ncbi:MAG: mechanosensitive ion channel [Proteobacteria bacterium]|nr:mechanosensitive ion channel [Pseudomonadota bacterium]